MKKKLLSERVRPNSEAAPWVIDEIKLLESALHDAYLEIKKINPQVVFDKEVHFAVKTFFKK